MATQLSKDIKYLGRDFVSLKNGLIDFAKTYYPNTYNDFNESDPGMMFIEMAAYVGDVLNYYIDAQFKESLILHATERNSILSIAAAMGYKPKLSVPSVVDLDIYQLLPPSGSGANVQPDLRYALRIQPGMVAKSSVGGIEFVSQNTVDFSINNVYDPTEISVYSIDNNGAPNYYLAKKTTKAISATTQIQTFVIGSPTKFYKILLEVENLIGIQSITDSNGNTWYEVPYLAQDSIFEQVENTSLNDPDAATYSSETPYLLKLKRVPRRFVARTVPTGLEIQFGAAIVSTPDEELLPTPENIGLTLPTGKDDTDSSLDPASPIFTTAYGIAPSNITLTVTYLVGGGIASNVPSNTITQITNLQANGVNLPTSTPTLNTTILNSVVVNNPIAASGGRSEETIDEIRQNTIAQLSSQNRAVTREDYIIRAYSMPVKYGSVSKVYITPDEQNNIGTSEINDTVANPLAMNMYTLGYNSNKNLTIVNRAVKENLKTYLSQYRMLTDSINIRDAYVINIGVDFDIISLPSFNANEVLLKCVETLKSFFNPDAWQINQPIIHSDIFNTLLMVKGVQTVSKIQISNLNDGTLGYSNVVYSIKEATRNGIVYPSLDPAIFEVKYPNNDIRGRIATY